MQNYLEEKKYFWLAKLNNLEKEIRRRQEVNVNRLSEEISCLGLLITEMEKKCQQPAPEFLRVRLQSKGGHTKNWGESLYWFS